MTLSALWLALAAAMALVTLIVHVRQGGRDAAAPLLASSLEEVPKYTLFYSWHLTSIVLVAQALGFILPIFYPGAWALAVASIVLAFGFAIWSLALIFWAGVTLWVLPQWLLFLPMALLGMMAIVAGGN